MASARLSSSSEFPYLALLNWTIYFLAYLLSASQKPASPELVAVPALALAFATAIFVASVTESPYAMALIIIGVSSSSGLAAFAPITAFVRTLNGSTGKVSIIAGRKTRSSSPMNSLLDP